GYKDDSRSAPEYDDSFDLFEPVVQAWLLHACAAARAESSLLVRSEVPCWIEAFANFVKLSGGAFPISNRSLASEALQAFMSNPRCGQFCSMQEQDVATSGESCDDSDCYSARPIYTRLRFKVNLPVYGGAELLDPVRLRWKSFVEGLDRGSPASAGRVFMASAAWAAVDMETSIISKTAQSFMVSMGLTVLSVALFTRNFVLTFYVGVNILLVVCLLFGFVVNILGYEFDVILAIGATIFVGMSVDYCLHLAHGYNHARGVSRGEKLQLALVHLGPSIIGGAVTTIAGTVFLLPCRMVLFVKLGWMLTANAIFSVFYTFFFLCPLLIVIGPTHDFGSFSWLVSPLVALVNRPTRPMTVILKAQNSRGELSSVVLIEGGAEPKLVGEESKESNSNNNANNKINNQNNNKNNNNNDNNNKPNAVILGARSNLLLEGEFADSKKSVVAPEAEWGTETLEPKTEPVVPSPEMAP
ncbi:unnamed protein product, partial [Polarella glacialis]